LAHVSRKLRLANVVKPQLGHVKSASASSPSPSSGFAARRSSASTTRRVASRSTKSGAPSTTSVSRSTARTASGISLISAKRTAPPLPSESGRLAVRSTLSVLRDGVPAATRRAQH